MQRRDFLVSSVLVALGWNGAGCGGGASSRLSAGNLPAQFAKYRVADEPNGDLAKIVWPSFVTEAPPEVKTLYEFQITHGDLMKYMPCYCGCGQRNGHKNNRDCYVQTVKSDGSVVLDSMAPT